ncbi:hypothetical protein OSSY52_18780 [Tepiditoga spiralis]|uniref:VWFA domain-containing protein n=1 Tax=Tepiditoga spiralis TaxID=2108365 RepID=A0A7G1G9S9_9BACT|nr:VWA domain-containing protein [Tepiditoga spiralis]BBE31737.1 hypothetical protein OSSY52_18780 [Tepiditoga spiralis]
MNKNLLLKAEELVDNPNSRIPICLCLDVSSSMEGEPINELNEGIKLFYRNIYDDEIARAAAELAIVTFGGEAYFEKDFSSIDIQKIPILKTFGNTPLGEGVNLALNLLEKRKEKYKEKGIDYYQPWLVLMTDGMPNGDENELKKAIKRTQNMVNNKKLTIFPIAIGQYADIKVLNSLSPKRVPLKLKDLNFKKFFEWLSKSVSITSQSNPGDKIKLDVEEIKGWAEL